MKKCEVGNIYLGGNRRYYLAISNAKLIAAYKGKISYTKPKAGMRVARLTVEELCETWGISLEQLDQITATMLPAVKTSRIRGPRRKRDSELAAAKWKELRTVRTPS